MRYLEESVRPWGRYQKFFHDELIWVKRLEVYPRSRLSLQKHQYRFEKWIFVQGQGVAVIDGQYIPVSPGQVVDIPLGAIHRMCNFSDGPLVFIEVAYGEHLHEDDIIRVEDDYNRASPEEYKTLMLERY